MNVWSDNRRSSDRAEGRKLSHRATNGRQASGETGRRVRGGAARETVARRLTLTTLASLCALVGLLAFAGASAQARVTHEYIPALSEKLSELVPATGPHGESIALPGLRRLEPSAAVVDSGRLWVAENGQIDEYDAATGEFMAQIANTPSACCGLRISLAIGHVGGEGVLYVTGIKEGRFAVSAYSETGTLKGTWTGAGTPAGSFDSGSSLSVAVDNSADPLDEHRGDVYLADSEHKVVDVFSPEVDGAEHYVGQIKGPSPSESWAEPLAVAINEINGDVVIKDREAIDILEPAGLGEYSLVHRITGTASGPFSASFVLAVDGATGDIYTTNLVEGERVIDQFSSAGAFVGQFSGSSTPSGEFGNLFSLAVDQESHVYVTEHHTEEAAGRVDAFSADIVVPDVATEPPSSVEPFAATLNGTVDPDNAGRATCWFEWGTTIHLGKVVDCEPKEVASPTSVHALLSGLEPDTTYFYRLQASNANGTNHGEGVQDQEFTTPGPGFREASVTNLASTSATFQATINPHEVPSSVYFQYGTSTAYGSDVPAPPGEAIGSGEGYVEVTPHHVQGLQAGTVYHYRAVAVTEPKSGEVVVFDGPDHVFTTETAAVSELPDGRHWEMVSPPDKKGARIEPIGETGVERAADSGGAISYETDLPTEAEPQGNAFAVQVLSTRGAEGWGSRDIALPHVGFTGPSIGNGDEYRFFSDDLSLAVAQPPGSFVAGLSAEASEQTAMLRTLDGSCGDSCYRPLVTGKPGFANVPSGTVFGEEPSGKCKRTYCGPQFVDATPDLRHIVLEGEVLGLVEWSGGKLTPIGRNLAFAGEDDSRGAISRDGSLVVLREPNSQGIYVRDLALEKTVQLNVAEPACVAEGKCASGGGTFQLASTDGSKVFFTNASSHRLVKKAGVAVPGVTGSDLYECEMVVKAGELECELSDIAKEALGVLGASEDGSYVYFVADSVLAEGAVPGECERFPRVAGAPCNLYVRHDGVTKFVAVLSYEDIHDWVASLGNLSARVSPDGKWAEFMAQRSVTGYDNRDAISGKPDAEVYLYDASAGRVVCASCDPTGARPTGAEYRVLEAGLTGGPRDVWEVPAWVAANVPGWIQLGGHMSADQPRYLSDSGRLFFNSGDALVPEDVNGTEDVYEYEPPGVGDCTSASATFRESSGGCVGLISSGTSAEESAFLDASENGGDVFFLTTSRLQPQDYDSSLDVYDAHECTSVVPCFPTPVPRPPACTTAEACRAASTPQPASFGAPSSATFSGAGNIAAGSGGVVRVKSPTRAQKLASALKACRRKPKKRRAGCEKRVRAQYGKAKPGKAASKKGKR